MSSSTVNKKGIKAWLTKEDGAKTVIHVRNLGIGLCSLMLVVSLVSIYFRKSKNKVIRQSNVMLIESVPEDTVAAVISEENLMGISPKPVRKRPRRSKRKPAKRRRLYDYGGPMVIQNTNHHKIPPRGIRMQGTLMHQIDTRMPSAVEVLLTSGLHYKEKEYYPQGTIVLGSFSYPGSGSQVYLKMDKAIKPDGSIHSVNIRALNLKTKQLGIAGKRKRQHGKRLLSTLGTTMVGTTSDVLTQREALNQFGEATIKASLGNAALQSVYRMAELETQRNLNEFAQNKEYVIVPQDTVLWIELLPKR